MPPNACHICLLLFLYTFPSKALFRRPGQTYFSVLTFTRTSRNILLLPPIYPLLTFLIVLKILKAGEAKVIPAYHHLISISLSRFHGLNQGHEGRECSSHWLITISNGSFLSILLSSTGLSQKLPKLPTLPTLCLFPFPLPPPPYAIPICALE